VVDDEENVLRSLVRLLRNDGYRIHTANSAREGFEVLSATKIGVIISDERMPEMSGVEFLSKVKDLYPDTVRIVLSGYTDLKSVTKSVNEGAIYKFLTKPWDDDVLRVHVKEAFDRYSITRENQRLHMELQLANRLLADTNRELVVDVEEKTRYVDINTRLLQVAQDVLESLPIGIIGIDIEGIIALVNAKSVDILSRGHVLLVGAAYADVLPADLSALYQRYLLDPQPGAPAHVNIGHKNVSVFFSPLGVSSEAQGHVIALVECDTI
jgi:FixJ family two-component response regulator